MEYADLLSKTSTTPGGENTLDMHTLWIREMFKIHTKSVGLD